MPWFDWVGYFALLLICLAVLAAMIYSYRDFWRIRPTRARARDIVQIPAARPEDAVRVLEEDS